MRRFFLILGLFFSQAHAALPPQLSLDLNLKVEGRDFKYKALQVTPGRLTSLISRADPDDPRAYSLEIFPSEQNELLQLKFALARVEAGKRETLAQPSIVAKLGQSAVVSQDKVFSISATAK